MRILFLYGFPLTGSGSGTYLRNLAKTLSEKHDVAIVCPDSSEEFKTYEVALPFGPPVFRSHPKLLENKKYSDLLEGELKDMIDAYYETCLYAVGEFRPDIILVQHLGFLTHVAKKVRQKTGARYVACSHGTGVAHCETNEKFLSLVKDALSDAEAVFSISDETAKEIRRVFGYGKIYVINGGVDSEKYSPGGKSQKTVFFTGRLVEEKGVYYLIKAAEKLPQYVFIIGGEGEEKKKLEKEAKGLKNVEFSGFVSEEKLIESYRKAGVVVIPSVWNEPFGLVALEAMSCGKPLIVTNKGALPLFVENGETGLIVPAQDSEKLAEAIGKILGDEKLAEKMGRKARKTVLEKYDWRVVGEKLINTVREVLKK